MKQHGLSLGALILGLAGLGQAAQAGHIHAKAALAQVLIRQAWVEAEKSGGSPRPWPWADTTPVARLGAPFQGVDLMVLEGGSGRTLAFGPGRVTGTASPGARGNVVIGRHRDTHFRFLKDLRRGDRLWLQGLDRRSDRLCGGFPGCGRSPGRRCAGRFRRRSTDPDHLLPVRRHQARRA